MRFTKNSKTRICTKCNIEYPNTNEYFCYSNKKSGRLESICKTCKREKSKKRNIKMTNKHRVIEHLKYDGTKKCIKCNRDLPNDYLHFCVDKTCTSGLRNVCRECSPNYGNFLNEDYIHSERWTQEDIQLLKSVYHDYTNEELVDKFFPNRTKHALDTVALKNNFAWKSEETYMRGRKVANQKTSQKLKGRKLSEEQRFRMSQAKKEYYKTHSPSWKGKKRSPEHCKLLSESAKARNKWKGELNPRHLQPLHGHLNGNWQGGTTKILQELRSDTKDWFIESAKFCNYMCVITGASFDNVHHTVPFKDLVDETFALTGIDKRSTVLDYSEEMFDELTETLKLLHNEYGFGACVNKEVHKLFHDNYGYKNFTPFDFLDFVYRIDIGEFDQWFELNNLPIDINYNYIEYLENISQSLEFNIS